MFKTITIAAKIAVLIALIPAAFVALVTLLQAAPLLTLAGVAAMVAAGALIALDVCRGR